MNIKSLAGCLVAGLLGVSALTMAAESASKADPVNGKRLFMTYGCYECHGTTGAGGGVAGPRLTPNPLPFLGLKAKLRTASGRMPVFSEAVLKDAEIVDIYAYLESIPEGRSAREIDLLNR
jgi:mono/diheme cytochrome c family protein